MHPTRIDPRTAYLDDLHSALATTGALSRALVRALCRRHGTAGVIAPHWCEALGATLATLAAWPPAVRLRRRAARAYDWLAPDGFDWPIWITLGGLALVLWARARGWV